MSSRPRSLWEAASPDGTGFGDAEACGGVFAGAAAGAGEISLGATAAVRAGGRGVTGGAFREATSRGCSLDSVTAAGGAVEGEGAGGGTAAFAAATCRST